MTRNNWLLVLVMIFVPMLGFSQEGWIPYRSPEGGFKIATKGIFKEVLTHAETGIGKITVHNLVYQDKEASSPVFVIMYYDFPEKSMHSDSTEMVQDFFKETIESAVESTGGTLIYESEVSLHGFKGKQWRINYSENQGMIKSQAFLVENRYYSLSVMSPTDGGTLDMNKFFNSFRLIAFEKE